MWKNRFSYWSFTKIPITWSHVICALRWERNPPDTTKEWDFGWKQAWVEYTALLGVVSQHNFKLMKQNQITIFLFHSGRVCIFDILKENRSLGQYIYNNKAIFGAIIMKYFKCNAFELLVYFFFSLYFFFKFLLLIRLDRMLCYNSSKSIFGGFWLIFVFVIIYST